MDTVVSMLVMLELLVPTVPRPRLAELLVEPAILLLLLENHVKCEIGCVCWISEMSRRSMRLVAACPSVLAIRLKTLDWG
eukprot:2925038-Amphidinium_carterae.1